MRRDILKVALHGDWLDYRELIAYIEQVTKRSPAEVSHCVFHPDTISSEHLQKIWLKTLTMKLRGRCAES